MGTYIPPSLLAPLPPSGGGDSLANLGSIVGGFLTPIAPVARVAADVYGAKQAAKTAATADKRAFELERLALQNATAGDVKATFLSPPVFIMGATLALLAVYLLVRRK